MDHKGGTMAGLAFESKRPGVWERDLAHMPRPVTPMFAELWPQSFEAGFTESFERYGVPLQCIAMQVIHGFVYMSPLPLQADAADMGALIARRAEQAERAFADRIWREQLAEWDQQAKPASMAAHRSLAIVDLPALSDDALALHVGACMEHHRAMVRQHHRFNGSAMLPVGDFAVHVMTWTGLPAHEAMTVFEGYSPMSGIWSDEIAAAARAVNTSGAAQSLADGDGDAAKRLFELRRLLPEVDEYLQQVSYRVIDSFDITAPTIGEMPALALGKLRAAAHLGDAPSRRPADEAAARLRELVPEELRADFDRLLAEARSVYRLRDERGVCSDMSSAGILRLALLELGRRLVCDGRAEAAEHALYLSPEEALSASTRRGSPPAPELADRANTAMNPTIVPPHSVGEPVASPPPGDLPPAMLRAITAFRIFSSAAAAPGGVEGEVLRGIVGHPGHHVGTARVIHNPTDLLDVEPGDVIVAATTSEAFNAAIFLAGAVVTDHGGLTSHAAIVAREVGIPAVVGTNVATTTIASGDRVEVDATEGTVTVLR